VSVFAYKLFYLVADIWLSAELNRSEVADTIANDFTTWILLIRKSIRLRLRARNWLRRQVYQLLCLQVLQELVPGKCKGLSELVDTPLLSNLDLVPLERLLLAASPTSSHQSPGQVALAVAEAELLLVVRGQIADERVEVQKVAFQLGLL